MWQVRGSWPDSQLRDFENSFQIWDLDLWSKLSRPGCEEHLLFSKLLSLYSLFYCFSMLSDIGKRKGRIDRTDTESTRGNIEVSKPKLTVKIWNLEDECTGISIKHRFLIFIAFLLYFTHITSSGSEYSSPGQFTLTICSFIYPCAKSWPLTTSVRKRKL